MEEGLSQSTVRSIVQDHYGFMWFATVDGLNRYDGYEFTIFKHDPADPTSLSENFIWNLYLDSSGDIWVGTEGGGLDRFDHDTQQFAHYRSDESDSTSLSSDFVRSIHEDSEGNLWIGTLNGLNKLDHNTDQFTHYPNESAYPGEIYDSNYITAIHEDVAGKLWVGTMSGLYEFNPQQASFRFQPLRPRRPSNIPEGPSPATVYTIYEDDSARFWIGSASDGLFLFDPLIGKVTNYPYVDQKVRSLGHPSVFAIQQDKSGDIWIGTGNGLDKLEAGRSYFIHYQHDTRQQYSLDGTAVAALYEDASGILWVGTNTGGINRYDPLNTKFQHIQTNPDQPHLGISNNKVLGISEDQHGQLWVATETGLDMWNQDRSRFRHYYSDPTRLDSLPGETVTAVMQDRSGNLWIGTDAGLAKFDAETETFSTYRYNSSDPFSINHPWVSEIYQDHFGQIWVGTAGGGLDRLDRSTGRFTHYPYHEEDQQLDTLNFNYITKILDDNNGNLWVASRGGLARYDFATQEFTYFTHDPIDRESLSHDYVNAIHLDQSNNLWIGTGFGLDRFEPGSESFVHYREREGLSNNMVLAILEDRTGTLWLSTNRGLSNFDPQTERFENYDTGDGLRALEFSSGSAFQGSSGEMFFGWINGFNAFYPEDIKDNPYKPPIVVTDFQILNRSVSTGPNSPLAKAIYGIERIDLTSKDTAFSFEIAALHYNSPEENQYAYIMEGFDEEWNLVGNRRFATFTNLPPGEYTFRAIGSNSDGVWNTDGVNIAVTIPYPFWQNWWFIGLVSMVLVCGGAGVYWLRSRSAAARTLALEELVLKRTSEIERRRQIAEVLRDILVIINSNRTLEESLHYIVDRAAQLTDAEDAIVFHLGKKGSVTIVATNPGGQIRYEPGEAILEITKDWAREALLEKRPMIIPDLSIYWIARESVKQPSLGSHRALLGIPLFLGDEIYGGLFLFYTAERSFSEEDLELGFTIGDQAALAVGNDR
ncbi:MAG: GAF domain-containing protein, partial [Deltaproteobacteria bacterium]|nr:GAF domain-containing protein [Deltaproteobacteria bacterium]